MTTTIEKAFGSGIMVRGFLLNNQLTDFSFLPIDEEGRPSPIASSRGSGRAAPWTRPSCSPRQASFAIVLGSPGGPGIILFNLKAIVALIDWKLDPQGQPPLVNFGSTGKDLLLEPGAASIRSPQAMAQWAMRSIAST